MAWFGVASCGIELEGVCDCFGIEHAEKRGLIYSLICSCSFCKRHGLLSSCWNWQVEVWPGCWYNWYFYLHLFSSCRLFEEACCLIFIFFDRLHQEIHLGQEVWDTSKVSYTFSWEGKIFRRRRTISDTTQTVQDSISKPNVGLFCNGNQPTYFQICT